MAHSGPLHSAVPGRTDHLPISVAPNSYVIPADVVSGIGEGNSAAGHKLFSTLLSRGPYGAQMPRKHRAAGGSVNHDGQPVPIMAAGGEYVVPPEQVAAIGGGDVDKGHKILDAFVLHVRKKTIKTMQKLPGPKRD